MRELAKPLLYFKRKFEKIVVEVGSERGRVKRRSVPLL